MITADHDRSFDPAGPYQMSDPFAEHGALAVSKPTYPRGQSLEMHLLTRETNPAAENLVFWKKLQNQIIRNLNIQRVSRQRDPAERSTAFSKQRPDICRDEAREVIGVFYAAFKRHGPDIVAVIERQRTPLLHFEHGGDVNGDRFDRPYRVCLGIGFAKLRRFVEREPARNISVQRVVRAGLVCENIRDPSAADHFGENIGTVSQQANR